MKIKKILVPVDFSEYSDKAVDHALLLGEKFGASITLLHVITLFETEPDDLARLMEYTELVEKIEARTYSKLREISKSKEGHPVKIHSLRERSVSAADKIVEVAAEQKFDLVVMGTHGRSGIKKWVYGSVAEKVVRFSPVPVITVHNSLKKFTIDKVLVPIDFSAYSGEAVRTAIDLGETFGSNIEFLHVVNQRIHPSYYIAGVESLFAVNSNLKPVMLEKLKRFVDMPERDFTYTVLEGNPSEEIVNYARETDKDMIIMATRGLAGIDHILLGSTAERVVRFSIAPVLTIRPDLNAKSQKREDILDELVMEDTQMMDFWDRDDR